MATTIHAPTDPELVTSLLRGLRVLRALGSARAPLSLSEVAGSAGTPRATARRLLLTLVDLGYVVTDGPLFQLRPSVMALGEAYLGALGWPAIARPHLEDLVARVRETCSLTVLDGTDVVYVDRVMASRLMRVDIHVGSRLPAFATSTGRVLLGGKTNAELEDYLRHMNAEPLTAHTRTEANQVRREVEQARRLGYAVADQELDLSMRSVAAPVAGPDGQLVAALNIATHVSRVSLDEVRDRLVPQLLETTHEISRELFHSQSTAVSAPDATTTVACPSTGARDP